MWDLALLAVVPGLRMAAPRDAATLREELDEAVTVGDAPTVRAVPQGRGPGRHPGRSTRDGGVDVLHRSAGAEVADVLVVSVGALAALALDVAHRLEAQGIGVTVVDPRWVLPTQPALLAAARDHRLVVVVEDGVRTGGVGTRLAQDLRDAGCDVPVHPVGLPTRFLDPGSRSEVLSSTGLTAQTVARDVAGRVAGLGRGDDVRGRGARREGDVTHG